MRLNDYKIARLRSRNLIKQLQRDFQYLMPLKELFKNKTTTKTIPKYKQQQEVSLDQIEVALTLKADK